MCVRVKISLHLQKKPKKCPLNPLDNPLIVQTRCVRVHVCVSTCSIHTDVLQLVCACIGVRDGDIKRLFAASLLSYLYSRSLSASILWLACRMSHPPFFFFLFLYVFFCKSMMNTNLSFRRSSCVMEASSPGRESDQRRQ